MRRANRILLPGLLLPAAMLLCTACGDGTVGGTDGGTGLGDAAGLPDCAASQQSGLWLLAFGSLTADINTASTHKVTVVVNRRSANKGEGSPAAGQQVTFKLLTLGGDGSISAISASTDKDGQASTLFTAGQQANVYQVQATSPGTCAVTFSVDVKKPLRQLRIMTPNTNPFDTFTGCRVPIAAQASTYTEQYGNAGLPGEEVTFTVTTGQTSETRLSEVAGGTSAQTLKVKANASGLATVMLNTGSKAISQLKVVASMSGTADAEAVFRIQDIGTGGCKSDADCPLGYTCNNGKCQPPVVTPGTGCKSDADCPSPLICQVSTGKCLQGTGKACDPVEGIGCGPDEVCVGRQCAKLPKTCKDNSDCPSGYICVNGKCQPQGKPGTGGCLTSKDCPSGYICVNGKCVLKSSCKTPHNADRLKGAWKFDSMLHLRDALSPVLKGLLSTAGTLSSIMNGSFKISGIPSFISSLVSKYLKSLIGKYVPPWGQQLVTGLSNINDVCSDMRVVSSVKMTSAGTDSYVASEMWDLVEFTYQGKKVSSPPSAIPSIGQVKVPNYTSYEVCGTLFISKHTISNKVGGIIKWAINTTLSLITCSVKGVPCYSSVTQALQNAINCVQLGISVDQMVQSIWSGAPSVANLIVTACNSQKTSLINKITSEINALATKLSLLELSGTATIPVPGKDNVLTGGVWSGVLGSSVARGNFKGDFTAKRGP